MVTAPNGAKFTICKVIMSTKCSDDLITHLFAGVDVSPEGDVVIICDIDLRIKAEALLSHFDIYLASIFRIFVWEAFTVGYNFKMNVYQYCPKKNGILRKTTQLLIQTKALIGNFPSAVSQKTF